MKSNLIREHHNEKQRIYRKEKFNSDETFRKTCYKNLKAYENRMKQKYGENVLKKMALIRKKKSRSNVIMGKKSRLIIEYGQNIKLGPDHVCASCDRLFFKSNMKHFYVAEIGHLQIDFQILMPEGFVELCQACYRSLKSGKVPWYSLHHRGLRFYDIPAEVLKLTPLEERFVSPRIPFMKIFQAGMNQYKVVGSVVNVPTDVSDNVSILPRSYDETRVIPIALKKKKSFKSSVMFETVSPKNIIGALKCLKDCEVYKKCNITIDLNKPLNINSDLIRIENERNHINDEYSNEEMIDGDLAVLEVLITEINSTKNETSVEISHGNDRINIEDERNERNLDGNNSDDEFTDDENEPVNIAEQETLLQDNCAIIFAPGEGKTPMSLLFDEFAEEMSFIKIYGGNVRQPIHHLAYHEIVKSEIMRSDRRCAIVTKLLYCALKIRVLRISSSITFHMRKFKNYEKLTKEDLLSETFVKELVLKNDGFRVFKNDRGNPAFFEEKKKELFAMIRQLGPANVFLTLSAAETRWLPLLVILKKVIDKDIITEEQAKGLPYVERVRLINTDPVTCARYFEHRVREMFKLLRNKSGLFDEHNVKDYYLRVEFQHRGSPHVHTLLWLKDVPIYNGKNMQECTQFIDKYITCDTQNIDDDLVSYQTHHHTRTCERFINDQKICRFNIPYLPMPKTIILEPLPKDFDEDLKKSVYKKYKTIRNYLNSIYKNRPNHTMEEFFKKINITNFDEYIAIIRSTLNSQAIFLKRLTSQIRINGYNKDILNLHQANMDIQFITDAYACVQYVCNYINKSTKGISKLMYDVIKDIEKKGNISLKEKLKTLANKFINASEMSAQEAVYYCLSMNISECSKRCIFINTSHPEKRVRVVKPKKQLQDLPDGSIDIYVTEKLQYYVDRAIEYENICLADFTAEFEHTRENRNKNKKKRNNDKSDDDDNDDYEEEQINYEYIALKNQSGFVRRKKNHSIIRYVNFNEQLDPLNHYREQLMLFYPWRDERRDLLEANCMQLYHRHLECIQKNRKKYIFKDEKNRDIDTIIKKVENELLQKEDLESDDVQNIVAPQYQMLYDDCMEADIGLDINNAQNSLYDDNKNKIGLFPIPHRLCEDDYYYLMRSLNDMQLRYMLRVLKHFKTSKASPIYEIVLGGAGVGKSRLIEAIQQSLLHFYHSLNSAILDSLQILLTAPTGKAAFNICGITLHSAFVLPLNQNQHDTSKLSDSTSNQVYSKLKDLKLIIIDEVSMVGAKMFHHIDKRLREIFKYNKPFGGISVILFGDFNQLPPVADGYAFEVPKNNPYAAIAGNQLWSLFKVYELKEIMRQRDDHAYAEALGRLAAGKLNADDIKMFQSRQIDEKTICKPENCLHLFVTNEAVDKHNHHCLKDRNPEECIAIDIVNKNVLTAVAGKQSEIAVQKLEQKLKETAKGLKLAQSYGLPYSILLTPEIHYMITNNVDTEDGLVNGVIGILKKYDEDSQTIWMLFEDIRVGKNTRSNAYQYMKNKNIPLHWTPICKIVRPLMVHEKFDMTRRQYPLTPAEAITVHKSQGSTYNQIVINVKKMNRNSLYVACSRVTSLNGLFIQGDFIPPKPPASTNKVTVALEKLRKNPVQFPLKFIQDYSSYTSIVYCNAQSLHKHGIDINSDLNFTSAKILVIVETWYVGTDLVNISNFKTLYRKDNDRNIRKPYGIIVLAKPECVQNSQVIYTYNQHSNNTSCNIVAIRINNEFTICGFYMSPKTSYSSIKPYFFQMLHLVSQSDEKVLIVGDFNTDVNEKPNSAIFQDLEQFSFKLNVHEKSSTNFNTKIDLSFVRKFENCFSSYYENYFGHHKPINSIVVDEFELANFKNELCVHGHESSAVKDDEQKETHLQKNIIIDKERSRNDSGQSSNMINGFINSDGVSCYSNCIVQTLLHSDYIRNLIEQNQNTLDPSSFDALHVLASLYKISKQDLSSYEVRKEIEMYSGGNSLYSERRQQDCFEYFSDLLKVYTYLQSVCKISITQRIKCKATLCKHKKTEQQISNSVLVPHFAVKECDDTSTEHITSISRLIKKKFAKTKWFNDDTLRCVKCNSCGVCEENQYISNCEDVVFVYMVNEFNRNMKCNLAMLSKENLNINKHKYKLTAVIYYYESSTSSGHYNCHLLHNNTWLLANDLTVTEKALCSKNKNVYMLMYERYE